MECLDISETRKRKIENEKVTDLSKIAILSEELPLPVSARLEISKSNANGNNAAELDGREDLNLEVIARAQTPAETPAVKIVSGGLDLDAGADSLSTEQNSSGFGDELGFENEEKVNKLDGGDDNSHMLSILETDNLTFSDRLAAYSEIFSRCDSRNNVLDRIQEYVTENVEFSGWRAVWKVDNEEGLLIEVHMPDQVTNLLLL